MMSLNDQYQHQEETTMNAFAAIPRRRRSSRVRQISARYPEGHRNSGRSSLEIENFFNMEEGHERLFAIEERSSSNTSIDKDNSTNTREYHRSESLSSNVSEHRYIGNVGSFSSISDEQCIVENTPATSTSDAKANPFHGKGIIRIPRFFKQKAAANPAA